MEGGVRKKGWREACTANTSPYIAKQEKRFTGKKQFTEEVRSWMWLFTQGVKSIPPQDSFSLIKWTTLVLTWVCCHTVNQEYVNLEQCHMNLGWPAFQITTVSCLTCSKQKMKCMAEMEDQNISEIKVELSHHSHERIPQLSLSSHCCNYIYCSVTTLICSGSAFRTIF